MSDRVLLSPKLIRQQYGDKAFHEHWCPGCKMMHLIAIENPFSNGARWTWDGNTVKPTISPSVNCNPGHPQQCHYFIRNGQIEFCGDSYHELKGKTVELPDIPANELN